MAVQLLGTKLESFEIMLVMLRNFRGPPYQTNKKLIDYSFEEQYSDWTLAVCCSGSGASRVLSFHALKFSNRSKNYSTLLLS